jgi:hypothetical protein
MPSDPAERAAVPTALQLDPDVVAVVATAAAAVALLSLLLALLALARVRVLRRTLRRLGARPAGAAGPGTDPHALRHVGVVRYDAFGDMGGRLSFSAALYDDGGNGVVLSSINGRSETRTYAKALAGLRSEHNLSPEEQQAIELARRD